jgi:hypothetical protein
VSPRPREGVPQPRLYLDTSAYLTLLVRDPGWERLSDEIAGAELLSSVLLVLETRRNLVRLAREGALTPEQYKACVERVELDAITFTLRDLTLDICSSSVVPAVSTPRSLDLAHLRTALWFHTSEPLDRFVTLDVSQELAAKELGLPV